VGGGEETRSRARTTAVGDGMERCDDITILYLNCIRMLIIPFSYTIKSASFGGVVAESCWTIGIGSDG
jgi:hypothetical protein